MTLVETVILKVLSITVIWILLKHLLKQKKKLDYWWVADYEKNMQFTF